jgi:hypothetical protein
MFELMKGGKLNYLATFGVHLAVETLRVDASFLE